MEASFSLLKRTFTLHHEVCAKRLVISDLNSKLAEFRSKVDEFAI